jgi:hypothetical protein
MANPTVSYARNRNGGNATAGTVANGGAIDTSCDVDFAHCSIFKCAPTGTVTLTPINIGVGRTVRLHIRAGATAPTISWGTMSPAVNWQGSAPTYTNSRMTVVTLTNDGTETVGSFVVDAS